MKAFTAAVTFYYFPTTVLLTMCAKGLSVPKLKSQFAETQGARGRTLEKTDNAAVKSGSGALTNISGRYIILPL